MSDFTTLEMGSVDKPPNRFQVNPVNHNKAPSTTTTLTPTTTATTTIMDTKECRISINDDQHSNPPGQRNPSPNPNSNPDSSLNSGDDDLMNENSNSINSDTNKDSSSDIYRRLLNNSGEAVDDDDDTFSWDENKLRKIQQCNMQPR